MSSNPRRINDRSLMTTTDERITPALDFFLSGDSDRLQAAMDADPDITNLSWNGNTLLEWAPSHHTASLQRSSTD